MFMLDTAAGGGQHWATGTCHCSPSSLQRTAASQLQASRSATDTAVRHSYVFWHSRKQLKLINFLHF